MVLLTFAITTHGAPSSFPTARTQATITLQNWSPALGRYFADRPGESTPAESMIAGPSSSVSCSRRTREPSVAQAVSVAVHARQSFRRQAQARLTTVPLAEFPFAP